MIVAEKQFVGVVIVIVQNGRNLFIISLRVAVFCGVLEQKARPTTVQLL
jgi:hypothetical protein